MNEKDKYCYFQVYCSQESILQQLYQLEWFQLQVREKPNSNFIQPSKNMLSCPTRNLQVASRQCWLIQSNNNIIKEPRLPQFFSLRFFLMQNPPEFLCRIHQQFKKIQVKTISKGKTAVFSYISFYQRGKIFLRNPTSLSVISWSH